MKYTIDETTLTVEINKRLTTGEIAEILNKLAMIERNNNFASYKWKIKRGKKELAASPIG